MAIESRGPRSLRLALLALALPAARAAGEASCINDLRNYKGGSFCHGSTVPRRDAAPPSAPSAPIQPLAGAMIGGMIGRMLAPNPANRFPNSKPPDASKGGVDLNPAPACPNDPDVVCLASDNLAVDMAALGEAPNPRAAYENAAVPAPAHAEIVVPALPPELPRKAAETGETRLADAWASFADATAYADLLNKGIEYGLQGIKGLGYEASALAKMAPELLEKLNFLSEGVGKGAAVVGLADAAVKGYEGKTAEASGAASAVGVGMACPPAGFAMAACGQSDACANGVATGANAAINAPINLVAGTVGKNFQGNWQAAEYEANGMTHEEALAKAQSASNPVADLTGRNEQSIDHWVYGMLGHKEKR